MSFSTPIYETRVDQLPVTVYATNEELGQAAAQEAALIINAAIAARGEANVILATGNSQLTFLAALRNLPGVDWSRVNVFHMDEYIGISPEHRASFPLFLRRHFLNYVQVKQFYPVNGQNPDVAATLREYSDLLRRYPADLCALGIGENGHLAFNDPPYADFDDPELVKVVTLDERSRRQQHGEGHFDTLDEVPHQAITLTIPALLAAGRVLGQVPEARKAEAVERALRGQITETCPASILRQTPHAHLFLDRDAAAGILPGN
ncbi:MAG TPA: glucosamine-6-phosphate deaminase [Anaerolineae bacterium]